VTYTKDGERFSELPIRSGINGATKKPRLQLRGELKVMRVDSAASLVEPWFGEHALSPGEKRGSPTGYTVFL